MDQKLVGELARLIPRWLIVALTVSLIGYVFAMSLIAVTTEREVTLWPPKIGPGPKEAIVQEIRYTKDEIKLFKERMGQELDTLIKLRAAARENAANNADKKEVFSAFRENSSYFSDEIANFDKTYMESISSLEKKLEELEKKLSFIGALEK